MNLLKRALIAALAIVPFSSAYSQSVRQRLSDWVNPLIGTAGMGHTFPGACAPFGAVQLSPDTDTIPHNIIAPATATRTTPSWASATPI